MSNAGMADDAAEVLRANHIGSAHVAGFSGGRVIAQELALRHPELVRTLVLQSTWTVMDPYLRTWANFMKWLIRAAPDEKVFLEGLFLSVYTPRAHNDGTVSQVIEEVIAFPHKQSGEDLEAFLEALISHDTSERLPQLRVPALVLAGGIDPITRPELCRAVADRIPGSLCEVMEGESHQPFQEVPDLWNARVSTFWQSVDSKA